MAAGLDRLQGALSDATGDSWAGVLSTVASVPAPPVPDGEAGLREEFEMDSRFRNIEFKLNMLQQNTNFFIEMLHNQKR